MRPFPALLVAAVCAGASAQTSATYRVAFDATWSAATHPVAFPADAHFSPPVGATHDASVVLWAPGALASLGIEQMAEIGATALMNAEVTAAGAAVGEPLAAPFLFSPGGVETQFTATGAHPLVTFVTMVAPSPDWFVGVAGLDLRDAQGAWSAMVTAELFAYDAGTDSGETYTAPDADTQPRTPIARITTPPFSEDVPLGTFTFTRLAVAGEASAPSATLSLAVANPAPAGTTLRVEVPSGGDVTVEVFSVAGRRVATLYAGPGGTRTMAIPALPAGVYAVRAESGTARVVRMVTVVR